MHCNGGIRTSWLVGLLAVSAASLVGCGNNNSLDGQTGGTGGTGETDLRPLVNSIAVTSLDVEAVSTTKYVLYPIDVRVGLDVAGEAFDSQLVISLASAADPDNGCVVGSLDVDHEPLITQESADPTADVVSYSLADEFAIPRTCDSLIGLNDIEVHVAFDIWDDVDLIGEESVDIETGTTVFYDAVRPFELSLDDCVPGNTNTTSGTCLTAMSLEDSPGISLVLDGFDVTSAVAVLDVADGESESRTEAELQALLDNHHPDVQGNATVDGESPEHAANHPDHPHFASSVTFRTFGVEHDDELSGDAAPALMFDIRPLARNGLTVEEGEWVPLIVIDGSDEETGVHPTHTSETVGSLHAHNRHAPVYLTEGAAEQIRVGEWAGILDYEIRACVVPPESATWEESDVLGGDSDNCGTIEVLIPVRSFPAGPEGHVHNGRSNDLRLKSTFDVSSNLWDQSWSDSGDDFGIEVAAGWSVGGSLGSSSQTIFTRKYLGGVGGWQAATAYSVATVFDTDIDLFRFEFDFFDYAADNSNTDAAHVIFRLFSLDFFPLITAGYPIPDGTVTLGNILDIASAQSNEEVSASYTWSVSIVGKDFSVDCGGANASVSGFITVGLDEDETGLTKSARETEANPCDTSPNVGDGDTCVRLFEYSGSWSDANNYCVGLGGWMASVDSAAEQANWASAFGDLDAAWVDHYYGWGPSTRVFSYWFFTRTFTRHSCDSATESCWNTYPGTSSSATSLTWGTGEPVTGSNYSAAVVNDSGELLMSDAGLTHTQVLCEFTDAGTVGGSDLTLVVAPAISGGVAAAVSADFAYVDFGIDVTLNLIDFTLPITNTLGYDFLNGSDVAVEGTYALSVDAELAALSGSIEAWIAWRTRWSSGTHRKTLVEWDGVDLGSWNLASYSSTWSN